VLCRSELDRERFLRLGAEPSHCRVVGNIKFAALSSEPPAPIELGRDYVMAASSRDGEERLIVEAWQHAGRGELLVIAPRHPQRLETILSDLQPFGLDIAVRSRGEQPGPATRLYIADTFGELRAFMAGAQLVFMGGSLVAKGGHNILEPAALGKAVICGPRAASCWKGKGWFRWLPSGSSPPPLANYWRVRVSAGNWEKMPTQPWPNMPMWWSATCRYCATTSSSFF
jgi:3-deoxy-D-manno-octulosonic-acid transferase